MDLNHQKGLSQGGIKVGRNRARTGPPETTVRPEWSHRGEGFTREQQTLTEK